ncbi:helix-turn-helix transcriptional regulator [Nitritalea halalkaliphila]|nr:WYL domain-containing protein [Nitritalea halalkaliphila]
MAVDKKTRFRHEIIDKLLQRQSKHNTKKNILNRVNKEFERQGKEEMTVSMRTIQNDLDALREEAFKRGIQLVSMKIPGSKEHYFYYEGGGSTVQQVYLTEEDKATITAAFELMKLVDGAFSYEQIEKLESRMRNLSMSPKFSQETQPPEAVLNFEAAESREEDGRNYIPVLVEAIKEKSPLCITFKGYFKAEATLHEVSPYLLKQYNRRWFLLCYSEQKQKPWTLPLDRIQAIEAGMHAFVPYPISGEKPFEFFEDIIGVTNDFEQSTQQVSLLIRRDRLPYLLSKVLHGSQSPPEETDDPKWARVRLSLKPNPEFFSQVLQYGEAIRIESPPQVKEQMAKIVKKMTGYYL